MLKAVAGVGACVTLAACGPTIRGATQMAPPATTVPLASLGLVPAALHIADRVVLGKHKVQSGSNIAATLVVTNASSNPIDLTQRCQPDFAIVVSNRIVKQVPAFTTSCRARPLILRPGANSFPMTVATTYLECLQPGGHSVTHLPACTHNGPPPLPAGDYHTVLYGSGDLELPEPAPVDLQLT
jgi:hypothetical protein